MSATDPPIAVGEHCSAAHCRTLDFLPIQCQYCSDLFCQSHFQPTSHFCTNDPEALRVEGGKFTESFNDFLPDRSAPPPERAEKDAALEARKAKAREVLEKNFGNAATSRSGGSGAGTVGAKAVSKAKPLSPALALMKLKQRAKQGDPRKTAGNVPMDERIYFTVHLMNGKLDGNTSEEGMKELWLPKSTTAGKALDLFATHFGIENVNNSATDPAKLITLTTPDALPLPNSKPLSTLIANGGTLWILKGVA